MSDKMTGRWYPVAIQGQKFIPVGQLNISGYATYNEAQKALEGYANGARLEPPYAIIFVQITFDRVTAPQKFKLIESEVDPWEFLAS